jgi:transcriptional regulator with XRE-family HTH domain
MSRKKVIKNIVSIGLAKRGNRLKSWWKSKGWSKAEFARRMSIWPQNVNKYFSGELDPTNLIEQLMKEDCNVVWIIDGKVEKEQRGMVAEAFAEYGKKSDRIPEGMSDQTRERVKKIIKLLESGPEKTDEEMLDLLIKTMEVRQQKKGKR